MIELELKRIADALEKIVVVMGQPVQPAVTEDVSNVDNTGSVQSDVPATPPIVAADTVQEPQTSTPPREESEANVIIPDWRDVKALGIRLMNENIMTQIEINDYIRVTFDKKTIKDLVGQELADASKFFNEKLSA